MVASGCLISCASAPVAASTVTSRSLCSRFNECNVSTSFAYRFVVSAAKPAAPLSKQQDQRCRPSTSRRQNDPQRIVALPVPRVSRTSQSLAIGRAPFFGEPKAEILLFRIRVRRKKRHKAQAEQRSCGEKDRGNLSSAASKPQVIKQTKAITIATLQIMPERAKIYGFTSRPFTAFANDW